MLQRGVEEDVAVCAVGVVEEGLERRITGADDGDEAGDEDAAVPVCEPAGCAEGFELLEDQGKGGCAFGFNVDEEGEWNCCVDVEDAVAG